MEDQKIEVILFTHKEAKHLSLGRSLLKTMGKEEKVTICQDYEKMLEDIRKRFGRDISTKKIYVDKVQGVREKYNLDIIPTLQVMILCPGTHAYEEGEDKEEDSGKQKRFSGNVDPESIFNYIDNLINDNRIS